MDGSQAAGNVQDQMWRCVDLCLSAHHMCLAMALHRVALGGEASSLIQVRLLLDCAELCQTHANLMSRQSEFHVRVSPLCAEACNQAATACEMLKDDPQAQACAKACRLASESCEKMTYAGSALGATV